jgi:hypothetical protein
MFKLKLLGFNIAKYLYLFGLKVLVGLLSGPGAYLAQMQENLHNKRLALKKELLTNDVLKIINSTRSSKENIQNQVEKINAALKEIVELPKTLMEEDAEDKKHQAFLADYHRRGKLKTEKLQSGERFGILRKLTSKENSFFAEKEYSKYKEFISSSNFSESVIEYLKDLDAECANSSDKLSYILRHIKRDMALDENSDVKDELMAIYNHINNSIYSVLVPTSIHIDDVKYVGKVTNVTKKQALDAIRFLKKSSPKDEDEVALIEQLEALEKLANFSDETVNTPSAIQDSIKENEALLDALRDKEE